MNIYIYIYTYFIVLKSYIALFYNSFYYIFDVYFITLCLL